MFRSVVCSELAFWARCRCASTYVLPRASVQGSRHPSSWRPFSLCWIIFALLSKTSCPYVCGFISGLCYVQWVRQSIFISVLCCFYYGFIILTIGWYQLSNSVLLQNCSILGPPHFHMDFRISLSVFVKRSLPKLRWGPRARGWLAWDRRLGHVGSSKVRPGAASLVTPSSLCFEALHRWCVFHKFKARLSTSREMPARSGLGPNPQHLWGAPLCHPTSLSCF